MTALGGGVAVEDPIVVSTDDECPVFFTRLGFARDSFQKLGLQQHFPFLP